MLHRILFLLITLFFVVMNVLLWRSEFGGRNELSSPVPAEKVWQKVLTAPDNSNLEIRHHGAVIGYCRWAPSIGEELATGKQMTDELPPEGMVRKPSSYSVDLEGSISLEELHRLRFSFNLKLTTNQLWQEVSARVNLKPLTWEIYSREAEKTVRFMADDEDGRTERVIKFEDFKHPEKLLRQVGGPLLTETLLAMGIPLQSDQTRTNAPASLGLTWEARNDWLKISKTRVRVYRLQARLLGRFQAVIFVSPVGEILRAELPDEVVVNNVALTNL